MDDAALTILSDPRWAAVAARDRGADGRFLYSVRTTGVYCRPSCASRRARPENVRFHADAEAAERAGFRACLRCRPDAPQPAPGHPAAVQAACRWMERSQTIPTLAALAREAGLSAFHFHRLFKAATGLTPRAYAQGLRAQRVRERLAAAGSVTQAIYETGYENPSRFYADADDALGMTPGAWRAGGAGETIRFAFGQCSLGGILVAQSKRGVCAILLGDEPDALLRDLQQRFPRAALSGGDTAFEALVAHVVGFVEAPRPGLDLALDVRGTAFQLRVWRALRAIPPGQTLSYAALAEAVGQPGAARAVAGACAANPLAVAIPCHRVVRTGGALAGYRWGMERKRTLLDREREQAMADTDFLRAAPGSR